MLRRLTAEECEDRGFGHRLISYYRPVRLVVAVLVITGCATAEREQTRAADSGITSGADANGDIDANVGQVDAAVEPDAGCTIMTKDLLANGNFDATPPGTGWTEVPAVAGDKLITPNDGIAEHSAPNKAWLGGIAQANAIDTLYQDVNIPPSTTMLVLSGYYDVRTLETGATVYDTGKLEIAMTNGTVIETVLSLDNAHPKTSWQSIQHTFATSVAGQTIRIRFTTKNDGLNASSFFFDTLALQATYCE